MIDLKESLEKIIREAGPIVIAYNGGSRPGQERAVIPLSVSMDELVAREVGQSHAKTFKLAKIASFRIVGGSKTENPTAVPAAAPLVPELDTLEGYLPIFEKLALERGLHVLTAPQFFAVCDYFKNGKPRKTPVVSIQFMDRSIDTVVDVVTGELIEEKHDLTGRERPWRIDSKRMGDGKSFAVLHRAAECFVQELLAAPAPQRSIPE